MYTKKEIEALVSEVVEKNWTSFNLDSVLGSANAASWMTSCAMIEILHQIFTNLTDWATRREP